MRIAQRRRHRRTTIVLSLLLPPLFAGALWSRGDWRTSDAFAHDLDFDRSAESVLDEVARRAPANANAVQVVREGGDLVVAARGILAPALLAYWTTTDTVDGLPDDAVLLGPVDATARRLRAPTGRGQVVVYSLGHGTVVGRVVLEAR